MLGGFVALFRHETDEKRDWREWGKSQTKILQGKRKGKNDCEVEGKETKTHVPAKKKSKQTEKQYITSLYV